MASETLLPFSGLVILFKKDAWKPVTPEVLILEALDVDGLAVRLGGLTMVGGGDEQLLSSPGKELKSILLISSLSGVKIFLLELPFCKDSKSWEIWASASSVSRLSWDLKTGGTAPDDVAALDDPAEATTLDVGPPTMGVSFGIPGSISVSGFFWYCFGKAEITLVPKVEKSKCSGVKTFSPVFSKKAFNSFRERNLFPVGPMMKTSYLPAEAPLFR